MRRAEELAEQSEKERTALNSAYWSAEKQIYAFALDNQNRRVDEASVLATVPMWFGLVDEKNASAMISQLAGHEHLTDWGMRILSNKSPIYSGAGYHYGSVWPLFTGWAAVGEYRYHREAPAYANLRANALLALDGSPGHVTEVLSGDYYQTLSTASPHQIWSAAMVISPVLRGALGLEVDATRRWLKFEPHATAWQWFSVDNVQVNHVILSMRYTKKMLGTGTKFPGGIELAVDRTGTGDCTIEFRPSISLTDDSVQSGAKREGNCVSGRRARSGPSPDSPVLRVKESKNTLRVWLKNDFGIYAGKEQLPPLGSASHGLRILSETWSASRDQLEIEVSGAAGVAYQIELASSDSEIERVDGASIGSTAGTYNIQMPAGGTEPYPRKTVVIHFLPQSARH